jgi:hypothetical protein
VIALLTLATLATTAPPTPLIPTLDNVLQLPGQVVELRGGAGARVQPRSDATSHLEFTLGWGVTDDGTVFCQLVGVCGRVRLGPGSLLLGTGLGFALAGENSFVEPWTSITWQQPLTDWAAIAVQTTGRVHIKTEHSALRVDARGGLAVLFQPVERVIDWTRFRGWCRRLTMPLGRSIMCTV